MTRRSQSFLLRRSGGSACFSVEILPCYQSLGYLGADIMKRNLPELWCPSGRMRLVDLPSSYYLVKFTNKSDFLNVLTGGSWKLWSSSFDPFTDVVLTTPVWVRLMDLPVIYYEETILMGVTSAIGKPIKVDKVTLFANKGRFA
ncbi:hypothetical protein V2J09_003743 [Rumex salicifolius]